MDGPKEKNTYTINETCNWQGVNQISKSFNNKFQTLSSMWAKTKSYEAYYLFERMSYAKSLYFPKEAPSSNIVHNKLKIKYWASKFKKWHFINKKNLHIYIYLFFPLLYHLPFPSFSPPPFLLCFFIILFHCSLLIVPCTFYGAMLLYFFNLLSNLLIWPYDLGHGQWFPLYLQAFCYFILFFKLLPKKSWLTQTLL